jgi:hypothetical protein
VNISDLFWVYQREQNNNGFPQIQEEKYADFRRFFSILVNISDLFCEYQREQKLPSA